MNPSLRKRLLLGLLLASAITWIVVALVNYFDNRGEIEKLFDAELAQFAKVILALSNHELHEEILFRGNTDAGVPLQTADTAHEYEIKLVYQVWSGAGRLAMRSSNSPLSALSQVSSGYSMTELDATRWRVYSLSDPDSGLTVHVGAPYDVRLNMAGQIAKRSIVLVLAALAIIGVLIWLSVSRALRPLAKVAAQVAARHSFDLSPIDHSQVPLETKPLTDALNNLLRTLDNAFYNERCFTSNAAHELRTPLAGIAAHNEVARVTDSPEQRDKALLQVKSGIQHLSRLTQQLLTLARCDQPVETTQFDVVDVHRILSLLEGELQCFARSKNIALTFQYLGQRRFTAIESAIEVLLRNIIDNAIRYTPVGGSVVVEVTQNPQQLAIVVEDSGPGIVPEQRTQVLQRFFRGEHAQVEGSGLGLSIVQRCVELHQGELLLSTSHLGGLRVGIRLPQHTPSEACEIAGAELSGKHSLSPI